MSVVLMPGEECTELGGEIFVKAIFLLKQQYHLFVFNSSRHAIFLTTTSGVIFALLLFFFFVNSFHISSASGLSLKSVHHTLSKAL
ncbi:hypothetical protein XELAEV_18044419mg [Xenopus laevis]|uniref:Uncharacterized protein n=1 Tax=Xenopus laevis TaxID=8355 RepID=A0A974BYZ9_XENLA|nr:hypothetical protein XELAEV_18044419mg [Xenopus laevis]